MKLGWLSWRGCGQLIAAGIVLLAGAAPVALGAGRSVKDFGADGTGARDDTDAIRRTIEAVSSDPAGRGGIVFLPAGQYVITDTLNLSGAGITIEGEGRGAPGKPSTGTVLVLQGGKTNTAVRLNNCRYSGVRNLTIGGNRGAAVTAENGPAIQLVSTYHCFVKEVLLLSTVCGVEILNGISPVLEDVDVKNPTGRYGFWVHGAGGPERRKLDAAAFTRLSGGAGGNADVEWLVVGPNVDGMAVHYARFVAGSRALVLRGGDATRGDTRPKYIHTYMFGTDHARHEAVLLEAGNDVFMVDTWIGQNTHASGMVIGKDFTGGAAFTNLRIRGSGGHGLHILGGRNIYVSNPLIGACATNRDLHPANAASGCGILIERGVRQVRITGGGVGAMYEAGAKAKQHYGIRYLGSAEQALDDSVRISGVDTSGNAVACEPAALSLDRAP